LHSQEGIYIYGRAGVRTPIDLKLFVIGCLDLGWRASWGLPLMQFDDCPAEM
jgi:hypothetical protein